MNKKLKLTLTFIACVALFVVVFLVANRSNNGNDDALLNELRNKIKKEVATQSNIDFSSYQMLVDSIDAWKKQGSVKSKDVAILHKTLYEEVSGKIFALYNDVLARYNSNPDKSHQQLLDYNELAEKIESDITTLGESAGGKSVDVKNLHSLYMDIRSLVQNRQAPTPDFDRQKLTWTSFDDQKQQLLDTIAGYRNNQWYAKIKHIKGFAEAVDPKEVAAAIEKCRNSYYEELAEQIMDYFDKKGDQSPAYMKVFSDFDDQTDDDSDAFHKLVINYKIYIDAYKN